MVSEATQIRRKRSPNRYDYKYQLGMRVIVAVYNNHNFKRDYYNYGTIVLRGKTEDRINEYTIHFINGISFSIPERAVMIAPLLDQLLYF